MKRVTAEEFIVEVQKRMARGMDYAQASSPYLVDDEVEPKRNNGRAVEVLEADLITPATDFTDDGAGTGTASNGVTWANDYVAQGNHLYESIGWQSPPESPENELSDLVEEIMYHQRQVVLLHAMLDLTKQEQAVVHAIYWDEARQQDIARGLGISQQAVSDAHRRALRKLREVFGLPEEITARSARPTWDAERERIFTAQKAHGRAIEARLRRTGIANYCESIQ